MTFNELATDAYVKNGVLAPGEVLAAELSEYALREGNRMLDQWNIQALFIWTELILTFPLTARVPPTVWYTIGPTGADFTAARPARIDRANILLAASTPDSRIPLNIRNAMQWSDVTTPALGTTLPSDLYNDGADPNSKLYLWPYPTTTANQLELFVWNQASRFAAVTDTFQMPVGYEDAFMLSLSERLIEGVRAIPQTLAAAAAKARSNVKGLNSSAPKISTTDFGMPGNRKNSGSFYDGWPTNGH